MTPTDPGVQLPCTGNQGTSKMPSDSGPELTDLRFGVDRAGVATILFDRSGETLNTLSPGIFADLEAILEHCESNPAVRTVVVGSAKPGSFIAGADIRWLKTLKDADDPRQVSVEGQQMMDRLEDLTRKHSKPVVAAIEGPCLGGGLEVAMACSGRVAAIGPRTQLGQPEIKLGLIPGAGGTQRLPRLVGVATGLEMILSGRSVRPERALRIGLVDELYEPPDLIATARRRALDLLVDDGSMSRKAQRGFSRRWLFTPGSAKRFILERTRPGRRVLFSKAATRIQQRTGGHYPAATAALRAVRAGVEKGRTAGAEREADEFAALLASPEANALISIFLATQELKKESGTALPTDSRPIRKVAVIGGGLMGAGIATVSIFRANAPTTIQEVDQAALSDALARIGNSVASAAKRRRMEAPQVADIERLFSGTTDFGDLADADLVIEAVFEDLDLKRSILAGIEAATPDGTIFASNTSSLSISQVAKAAKRPANVIGMHYFSPVERMPLLEIVAPRGTSADTIATAVAFGKRQGKTVIVVGDGPGFYTTRILAPYAAEIMHLMHDGAAIEEIDRAMVGWEFPIGPVMLSDEVGIDVAAKIAGTMESAFGERMQVPQEFEALLSDDRRGRKSHKGFYLYDHGDRGDADQSVYAVLGAKPTPGKIPSDEIQDRLVALMINEAVRCLEEGILRSARDGDIGAVMGLGFPPFRGGPFTWIDHVGPAGMVRRLEDLAAEHGSRFAPARLLQSHAAMGENFRT